MKIITLIENTCRKEGLSFEHGLSIYIETPGHTLLLDTGASGDIVDNASKLGIDLGKVDTVVLSHGHFDHCGGAMRFLKVNSSAKIYLSKIAAESELYKDDGNYIGYDRDMLKYPGLVQVDGNLRIDDELYIFSGIKGKRYYPKGNIHLLKETPEGRIPDDFRHEQYLVIDCEGKKILLSGCAHNGILNILDEYRSIYGKDPDMVLTGFHLMKATPYDDEDIAMIKDIARELSKMDTVFYSGHCTSEPALLIMKEIMGDQLHELHTGETVM